LGLPSDLQPLVAQWARDDSDALAQSGIPIIGDLGDLAVAPDGRDGVPSPDEVARAAGAALALRRRSPRGDD
jgi:hypothetical protein